MDDLEDSPVVPWRPDRANPRAQNLQAVLETVQTTTKRVADALVERARGRGLRADPDGSGQERPLLDPGHVVLFAHALSHSTRFERGKIERLGLARVALEEVRSDPEGAAGQALQLLANRSDHYAIHLDVDMVDFTDAPLSEHPSRNTGLKLDEMLRALRVLAWSRSPSPSSIPTTPRPTTGCWSASQPHLLTPSADGCTGNATVSSEGEPVAPSFSLS